MFFLIPAAGFCQEPWYAPQREDIVIPFPDRPADTLDTCPKLNSLKADAGYTDAPAVKEVAEVDGANLPLPADNLERAGILEVLKTDLDYWNSRPDSAKIQVGTDSYYALGHTLTAGRSIAIDPKYVPLGLFGLLKSKRPVAQGGDLGFKDFNRFISTHDTGSAIRGPGRVDLFWGTGLTAETEASSMKAPGGLYLFVAK